MSLDGAIGRLDALAAGAWVAPALAEMAPALEEQLRAKLEGNPRAKGILEGLTVTAQGEQLVVAFPDFAVRFQAADFARGDLSAYTASLSQIAARAVAAAME